MSAARETYSTCGPICPHCDHAHHDLEADHYDEDFDQMECERCNRSFGVRVYASTSWTCEPLSEPETGTETANFLQTDPQRGSAEVIK
jgi:hypothetical protein